MGTGESVAAINTMISPLHKERAYGMTSCQPGDRAASGECADLATTFASTYLARPTILVSNN